MDIREKLKSLKRKRSKLIKKIDDTLWRLSGDTNNQDLHNRYRQRAQRLYELNTQIRELEESQC